MNPINEQEARAKFEAQLAQQKEYADKLEAARLEWIEETRTDFVREYDALKALGVDEHNAGITARKLAFNGSRVKAVMMHGE